MKKVPRSTKDAPLAFSTKAQTGDKLEVFKFESSKQLQQTTDQGATRMNEMETQHDRDNRQVFLHLPPTAQQSMRDMIVHRLHASYFAGIYHVAFAP